MYAPFPHPRYSSYESYEGHVPFQQQSPYGILREPTDLSSIDLATEEEEEQHLASKFGYPTSDPEDGRCRPLVRLAGGLFALAALCGCIAAFGISKAQLPSVAWPPLRLPRWPPASAPSTLGQPGGLSARELLESEELTELAASRVQAADPHFSQLEGSSGVRERVAAGFRQVAASAAPRLNSLRLSAEQKDAVLQVLRDMSDNSRLHNTGLFVARILQEGRSSAGERKGAAHYVLERLQPRLPELRQLRDEVIPASLRSRHRGVLTLDSEKLRFVQTLGDRWNFEFESSMPRVADRGSPTPPMPRRLTQLGMNANTSSFIEAMRTQAQAAKGALATTNGDLTSAISGLDAALKRTAHDTADQQQVAKSMACDALTEATNAMDTVDTSLANMMAHLAKARRTVEDPASRGKARETVAKKVFRKLQADVANVQQHIKQDKDVLAKRLSSMQSLVSQISDSSLTSTRSSLMSAQGEIQQLQAELTVALKDFGALYRVVKGTGKLSDTVKLYASSVFYQLQEAFHVPMPVANNASVVLQECLEDPEGMITELECRLAYAEMVLEMFLGMDVDIRVDMSTSSTLPPIPMLPAVMMATTAAPTLAMQPVERSAVAGEPAATTSMQNAS